MAAGDATKALRTGQQALGLARAGADAALVDRLMTRIEELSQRGG
jgi:hypothetical protein